MVESFVPATLESDNAPLVELVDCSDAFETVIKNFALDLPDFWADQGFCGYLKSGCLWSSPKSVVSLKRAIIQDGNLVGGLYARHNQADDSVMIDFLIVPAEQSRRKQILRSAISQFVKLHSWSKVNAWIHLGDVEGITCYQCESFQVVNMAHKSATNLSDDIVVVELRKPSTGTATL